MSLEDQYNQSENTANTLLKERNDYVRQMRKLCAKQGTPFPSSRREMKEEIAYTSWEVITAIVKDRIDWYLPLKRTEIIDLLCQVILKNGGSYREDDDDDDFLENEWHH